MSAASRCLNNALILQKVLESSDLLANLQFRLVNKRFDREVLHQIRVSHRKIDIYVVLQMLINDSKIKVNGCDVHPKKCFMFLTKTVRVRIKEFELKTDRDVVETIPDVSSTPLISPELCDDILDVLLEDQNLTVFKGMNVLTDYCDSCIEHAWQSREYGPVQVGFLLEPFEEPKHFDRLIVDDHLMWRVACLCESASKSKNRKLLRKRLEKHIPSNVSCDHLQLSLYNHPDFFENGQRTPIGQEIPRELLEVICTKWKPKSVGLSVISLLSGRQSQAYWVTGKQVQTVFRFFDLYESTRASRGFMLDHVNVDMDDAPLKEIFKEDSSFFDDNLIANVRKVFPARHYFVNLHRMSTCHRLDQNRNEQLIRAVIRGSDESNTSPVTIRISTNIPDKPFDIPETLLVGQRVFTCSVSRNSIEDVFGTTRRIAKSFRISHKYTGLEMNLEIYVDRKQLEEAIGKHAELGFLKHYVD